MGRILFTWEIGAGEGHIAPYADLIVALEERDHEVFFALRELKSAFRLLGKTQVSYLQSPIATAPMRQLVQPANSFAKILNNCGYCDPEQLAGMIAAWQNLFNLVDPELVIFDYSPTAMLATRGLDAKRMVIGTGFQLPPSTRPFPGLAAALGKPQDDVELLAFENRTLDKINQALQLCHIKPLERFVDLLAADERILRTFAEMDHYQGREGETYWGISTSSSGFKPDWPAGRGKKVFAYLRSFETLPSFLKTLQQSKLPTLIYAVGIDQQTREEFVSDTLRFVDRPLDMRRMGETADIAVCNGNHSTTVEMLLAGVPLLLLPLHGEQRLVARNVVRMGAGLWAPERHPVGMAQQFSALVSEEKYRRAAQAFARHYRDFDSSHMNDDLVDIVDKLVSR